MPTFQMHWGSHRQSSALILDTVFPIDSVCVLLTVRLGVVRLIRDALGFLFDSDSLTFSVACSTALVSLDLTHYSLRPPLNIHLARSRFHCTQHAPIVIISRP